MNDTEAKKGTFDKLEAIFELQNKFDTDVVKNRDLGDVTPTEWIQKRTLAMVSELAEVLDEVNFKWWKNPKEVEPKKIKEELVDILHFYIGMCLNAGMDADELFEMYIEKNEENFKRQYGTSLKSGYELSKLKRN